MKLNNKADKKSIVPKIKTGLEMASCVIAVFTFVLAVFPNINFLSSNYEEKAKAGHAASQIYLAHYYYEIGDFEQSLYWYKLASDRGKYQGVASNNLAVLYELTAPTKVETIAEDLDNQILEYLVKSAMHENDIGIENLYNFLEKRNINYYNDFSEEVKAEIEQILTNGEFSLDDFMPEYKYIGRIKTENQIMFSTDETVYKLLSIDRSLSQDGAEYITYREYDVYEQDVDTQLKPLKYDNAVKDIK